MASTLERPSELWLNQKRIRMLAAVFLVVEIALFGFMVAGTHGWIVPLETQPTTDFVSFYAAGSLANAGTPELAYDHASHLAAEEAATNPGIEYQFFNYPPVFLFLCVVLARMPYLVAFICFESFTLALYVLVGRRILNRAGPAVLVVFLSFPIVFWNLGLGQNAFLTAALFGAGTLLVDRRPIAAGICFGALCYKPHLALLVPIALAMGGRWRCFAAAAASVIALVVGSIATFGLEAWQAFLTTAGTSHTMYESGRILFSGFASPFGAARFMGAGVSLAYAIQGVGTAVSAAMVAVAWRLNLSLPTRAGVLATGALVAAPIALLYDLLLPAIGACWLLRGDAASRLTMWERIAFVGLFLLLLDPRGLTETLHVPVALFAALVVFAMACHRMFCEIGESRVRTSRDSAFDGGVSQTSTPGVGNATPV
jgi:alpha-1,2-mannosyltransferase